MRDLVSTIDISSASSEIDFGMAKGRRVMFAPASRTAFAVLTLTVLAALPAAAQLTTGTLTGTIKDPQGGVIPGATVVITSEARGTQLPPAITNNAGDFVVANVAPDTYT